MLEKLINEHGSSAILKERLELFSDKYNLLEEKNDQFLSQNKKIEQELTEAKEEIKRLQNLVTAQTVVKSSLVLEDIEANILKLMFDANGEFEADEISKFFKISIGHTEYYINSLLKKNLISASYNAISGTTYYISTDGRTFIVEST